ncbi:type II secretion system protein [Viridibacillus sp. YIM B01967]|uniref:Type II secretion system protein n=1 Tax=Viridibacillus soli TaxID=2798301 RepID=A0ABS1H215_9BACL|nr:type II secretion system protein [Viridibacillus soli]MBK3493448.1 type II secretion system protein [Viridibacillus soli]
MSIFNTKSHLNEKGFTLIEVTASFVILAILLTAFFTFFIQTAKTGKSSENMVSATYIAQTEMEDIYSAIKREMEMKKNNDVREILEQAIQSLDYEKDPNGSGFAKKDSKITIKLKLKENNSAPNLKNIVIEVYENNEHTLKAKMENVFVGK